MAPRKDLSVRCSKCICWEGTLHNKSYTVFKTKGTYACNDCKDTFIYNADLKVHEVHRHQVRSMENGKRKFLCNWSDCDFSTGCTKELSNHMYGHTREYCYRCSCCSFLSTDLKEIRNHIRPKLVSTTLKKKRGRGRKSNPN